MTSFPPPPYPGNGPPEFSGYEARTGFDPVIESEYPQKERLSPFRPFPNLITQVFEICRKTERALDFKISEAFLK